MNFAVLEVIGDYEVVQKVLLGNGVESRDEIVGLLKVVLELHFHLIIHQSLVLRIHYDVQIYQRTVVAEQYLFVSVLLVNSDHDISGSLSLVVLERQYVLSELS